ncbi:hypothetical protein CC1G_02659 [Coprinopsis cinerea okayama7|uniref:Uncharacterized protein n=1 Tax=Coprinopsis cinerea (strain Okayama-7 / 130 / ATCC MYA-4618 / FGSC 9003) TaxID=240176 RepID=A8PBJ1_COPC7|nr:hypothetical protein CC1G_02659 [Coprinopsis cinerea okayama7\|eukprot:XP_001840196.1 hypothetical protein CC1G_02659 [Coprinopsis cinerea okayama7\
MLSDSGTSSSDSALSSGFSSEDQFFPSRPAGRSSNVNLAWVCDPTFGVVHRHGCTVCRSYKSHCVDASRHPDDLSFHHAVKDRDGLATTRYFEGVEEGRRQQAQQERTRMYRYRQERDDARARLSRCEDEIRSLRMELLEMQDAFMAMQLSYEDQIATLLDGPQHRYDPDEDFLEDLRLVDMQDFLLDDSESGSETRMHVDGDPQTSSSEPLSSDSWESGGFSSDSSSLEGVEDEVADHVPQVLRPSDSLTIQEVQQLISSASDPSNRDALARVKSLCSLAHRTPRSRRSPAQKYLLKSWKGPSSRVSSSVCHSLPPASTPRPLPLFSKVPPLSSVPEIIVDASTAGIGFLMKSKWLAWTLKDGWRSNGRDMVWAELAAVELGLRTAIALGVRQTHLRVRSDNSSVITALKTRTIRVPHDMEVLEHILALCRTYAIELMPVWIWTKHNPADALSRKRYPPSSLRVEEEPEIPPHLVPFVEPLPLTNVSQATSS